MNWQTIFYNLRVPDRNERVTLRNRITRRFRCDSWVTQDNCVIPVIFMRDSHMANAWHYTIRRALKVLDDYAALSAAIDSLITLEQEFKRREITPPNNPYYGLVMNRWRRMDSEQSARMYDDGDWFNSWMYTGDH